MDTLCFCYFLRFHNLHIYGVTIPPQTEPHELHTVTFQHCADQSKHKGKHTYTPTTLMSTCELRGLYSTCQCVHDRPHLIGTHMAAAGRYPLEMCDNLLVIVATDIDAQAYDAKPVQAGALWYNSGNCPACDTHFQNRDTLWRHLKTAHRAVAAQFCKRRTSVRGRRYTG